MPLNPAIPIWPRKLAPRSPGHGLTRPVMVGQQPLAGRPQSVMSDMGAWRITIGGLKLHDDLDRLKAFRALFFGTLALLQPIYIPFYDWRRNPYVRIGLPPFPADSTFGDGATFSDGSSFGSEPEHIKVAVAASARATTLIVEATTLVTSSSGEMVYAPPLPEAGELIGLGERAYMVTRSFPDTPVAGQTTLQIQPPLRAAALVEDVVAAANPLCRMKLDPKQVEEIIALDLGVIGDLTLDFYEDNW